MCKLAIEIQVNKKVDAILEANELSPFRNQVLLEGIDKENLSL